MQRHRRYLITQISLSGGSIKSHIWRRAIPLFMILLGSWLRFHALAQDRPFHPDEALFSTFARSAALNGDWMLPGALDKTPLAIYANALSQVFIGDSEFAARLPGTFASILLIPVMGSLAKRLYGNRAHLIAILLTALSPFAITFSATAFTDGMMLLFMTLALCLIVAGVWGRSGLALALAFACKQQALSYLPLVLALGVISFRARAQRAVPNLFGRFVLGFAPVILALLRWDGARGGTSIFALAAANNDPWRLIRANEISPRLAAWIADAQMLLSADWITLILVLIALAALAIRVIWRLPHRAIVTDLILFTFVLAYALLHWLVAFNTYDRYLLPILPPLILLVSRGLEFLTEARKRARRDAARCNPNQAFRGLRTKLHRHTHTLTPILLCALLLIPAINASEGRAHINDDYQQYEGIDELAAYLNNKPVATVIYDRWLGWELAYYMGQWTDKRRVYYPTPDVLAQGALALCEIGARYLPATAQHPITPYLEALREAGFGVTQVYRTLNFVVYEIIVEAGASGVGSSSPDLSGWCGDESR